jgi:uncharacterized protein with PIN domain
VPVRHLIETLGVPHTEVEVILVNGRSVGLEEPVQDGDRVSVYPMFESLDVTPLLQIRQQPLRKPRFIADAHLGKLAHYLRLLGFDTLFFNDAGDARLATLAATDDRVLLTRDKALLMHRAVQRGCYIRFLDPRDQLLQVLRRLDLTRSVRPFTRCMECNGLLQGMEKHQIENDLPIGVARHYNAFWRCADCGRIYWQGHHYRAMCGWVDALLNELQNRD